MSDRRFLDGVAGAAIRARDVLVSVLALGALSPVLATIAVAIRIDTAGPVLYRALRVGRDGRPFTQLKFRTMIVDADRGAAITGGADPRITRVGRLLRPARLDELPQLINVVRGDMSLVGPRPEAPHIVRHYTAEQLQVLTVRPGITGPTQLQFHDEAARLTETDVEAQYLRELLPAKLDSDLAYVRSRSFVGDLAILAGTARLVVRSLARPVGT